MRPNKESKALFVELEKLCKNLPREGSYLTNQLMRAANSVHANIAEGFGRSEAEFKQYLTRALGSNNEVISHLEDAHNVYHATEAMKISERYVVLGKRIYRLRENWKRFR